MCSRGLPKEGECYALTIANCGPEKAEVICETARLCHHNEPQKQYAIKPLQQLGVC